MNGNHTGLFGNADGMGILLKNTWKAKEGFYEGVEMELEQIIIVIIGLILVGLVGVTIGHLRSYNLGYISGVQDAPPCICDIECAEVEPCICNPSLSCRCPALPQFLQIARDLSDEMPYDREDFNCLDYSKELVRRLDLAGRKDFEVVYGLFYVEEYLDDGTLKTFWGYHAWVCTEHRDICIERGKVILPDEYSRKYREDK